MRDSGRDLIHGRMPEMALALPGHLGTVSEWVAVLIVGAEELEQVGFDVRRQRYAWAPRRGGWALTQVVGEGPESGQHGGGDVIRAGVWELSRVTASGQRLPGRIRIDVRALTHEDDQLSSLLEFLPVSSENNLVRFDADLRDPNPRCFCGSMPTGRCCTRSAAAGPPATLPTAGQ